MSLLFPASPTSPLAARPTLLERIKPFAAPYYLTIAAVLGAATAGFLVVILLLFLTASNFNLLGWIE